VIHNKFHFLFFFEHSFLTVSIFIRALVALMTFKVLKSGVIFVGMVGVCVMISKQADTY